MIFLWENIIMVIQFIYVFIELLFTRQQICIVNLIMHKLLANL